MSGRVPIAKEFEWTSVLDHALTAPGSLGNSYNRFHNYSFLNTILLYSQGCPLEPVGTFNKWKELGRHVKRGSKAKEIIRPITVKSKDEFNADGSPKTFTRFIPKRCIFSYSDTEGEALPEYEPPMWDKVRALGALAITEVPYESMDGNVAGHSFGRNVAVNPMAPYPFKTLLHEVSHVEHGHTAHIEQYAQHRGEWEFQAESAAYLVCNELAVPESTWNPSESRAYVQGWLRGQKPGQAAVRQVFSVTDRILRAGREVPAEEVAA